MSRNTFVGIGATVLVGWLLAACSSTIALPKDQVAQEIKQQLALQFDVEVDQMPAVVCPGDLMGVVGTAMTCTLSDSSGSYDVDVVVTAIQDDGVDFSIKVADEAN